MNKNHKKSENPKDITTCPCFSFLPTSDNIINFSLDYLGFVLYQSDFFSQSKYSGYSHQDARETKVPINLISTHCIRKNQTAYFVVAAGLADESGLADGAVVEEVPS